jgi:hypothetical protein
MNKQQLRKLRVIPGDLLLVRGAVKIEEMSALRAHFDGKVTIFQANHRNLLQRIPFEILEVIYEGAKKSYLAKKFEELGEPCVHVTLTTAEASLLASVVMVELDCDKKNFGSDAPIAESAAQRLRDALKPADALMEANNASHAGS